MTGRCCAPRFALHPNTPNPFNPTTRLAFELPQRGRAVLAIYDVRGRAVRTLADATLDAGPHTLTWDGTNTTGRACASGMYLARLSSNGQQAVQRLILLR